tara:strand:+ start:649 stop:1071 length:423 start_codon:yes stop_codon:yes gene_type:complete
MDTVDKARVDGKPENGTYGKLLMVAVLMLIVLRLGDRMFPDATATLPDVIPILPAVTMIPPLSTFTELHMVAPPKASKGPDALSVPLNTPTLLNVATLLNWVSPNVAIPFPDCVWFPLNVILESAMVDGIIGVPEVGGYA